MRWFRNNLRQGSWLALLALTINLVLSLGHVHAIAGSATTSDQIALATAAGSQGTAPLQGHDGDGPADDLCPICMAAHAIGSAVAPTPPALPVRFADAAVVHVHPALIALGQPQRAAFQSRAPPLS